MRRSVCRVHLIDRINDASAKELCPNAVDAVASEEAIVFRPQSDFDQLLTRAEPRLLRWRSVVVLRLLLDDLVEFFELFLRPFDGGLADCRSREEQKRRLLLTVFLRRKLHFSHLLLGEQILLRQIRPAEECRQAVDMILLPIRGQRVIVTLRAAYIHAEEQARGVFVQIVEFAGSGFHKRQRPLLILVCFNADKHVTKHRIPRPILLGGPE